MGLVINRHQVFHAQVGIALGGGEAGVPEEFLDVADAGPAIQQVGGEGMAQGMGADLLAEGGKGNIFV